jgi:pSer/pThr/pTyr-binding forkhead associated (FHA) protein
MARVILVFNKKVIKEYPFSKDSMTIGRDEANEIVIDNLAVSGHHARIDKTGGIYILTDLQSTNGTFANDKKITSYKLHHKDKITIGKHLLFFAMSKQEQAKAKDEELDKTMILDTAQQKELLEKQAEKKAKGVSAQQGKIGVVSFIDGSGEGEIQLTKKLTKIGKAETSEIRLSGLFMPPTAATISRRPNGYAITATTGKTKVKVNNKAIKESYYLNDFDTIEIGSYKFQFYSHDIEDEK